MNTSRRHSATAGRQVDAHELGLRVVERAVRMRPKPLPQIGVRHAVRIPVGPRAGHALWSGTCRAVRAHARVRAGAGDGASHAARAGVRREPASASTVSGRRYVQL